MFVIFNPFWIIAMVVFIYQSIISTTTICALNHQQINSVITIVVSIGRLFVPLLNDMACHIYGLFKMVFNCLWVVAVVFEVAVEFFEVVVDGFRWL